MVNKCCVPKCHSGYSSVKRKVASFHFPKDTGLKTAWIRFVNRKDWQPTENSVVCELHFEDKFLNKGKRCTLKNINPIPTIYPKELLELPSCLPTSQSKRNPPRKRFFQEDELQSFRKVDVINFEQLTDKVSPPGFEYRKLEYSVIYYNLQFDESKQFPKVLEIIKIDSSLRVKLQYNDIPLPLPSWLTSSFNGTLTKLSMLENLPAYIKNTVSEKHEELLEELNRRKLFQPKGRPPYSPSMIRYALLLRYTSLQAYKLLLNKFPFPSISLLNRIQQNSVGWCRLD